jgi:hypothetical protein
MEAAAAIAAIAVGIKRMEKEDSKSFGLFVHITYVVTHLTITN